MNIVKKSGNLIKKITKGKIKYYEDDTPVMNINYSSLRKQKKVLLCYLDLKEASTAIVSKEKGKSGAIHTNRYELFEIINTFIKLDFCIDVVSNSDLYGINNMLRDRTYDIVFGLGKAFRLSKQMFPKAYHILYLTENPYSVSYEREMERVSYYTARTGRKTSLFRTGMFFKPNDENMVDGIICLGDEAELKNGITPVKRMLPSAFISSEAIDFSDRERNAFIIFGTDGMVHKGVDIAFEVFSRHPEWKLYLCGYKNKENLEKLGYNCIPNNIIDCGYVVPETREFYEIMRKVSHVLLLSCSEGTSTGVLTCMSHGVLPIVTRGNGFEAFSDYCDFFEDFKIPSVEKKLSSIVAEDWDITMDKFIKTKDFACTKFSLNEFRNSFEESIVDLMEKLGMK